MKNTQIIQFEDIVNIPDLKSVYCNGLLGVKFKELKDFIDDQKMITIDTFLYYLIGNINNIEIFVDPYKSSQDFRIHVNKPTHEYEVNENPYSVDITINEIL